MEYESDIQASSLIDTQVMGRFTLCSDGIAERQELGTLDDKRTHLVHAHTRKYTAVHSLMYTT